MAEKEWYSDREIFEMIQGLKQDLNDTKHDLAETRMMLKKYNGLWEKIDDVDSRLTAIEQQTVGRQSVGRAVREWGGWIVAVIALILTWVFKLI